MTTDQVITAIQAAKGNLAAAARAMNVSRTGLYKFLRSHPTVAEALADEREVMLDNAESVLYRAVLAGEAWAVCFFLKTQGKSRGYVERAEVTGKDGGPVAMTWGEFVKQADADTVRSTP